MVLIGIAISKQRQKGRSIIKKREIKYEMVALWDQSYQKFQNDI